MRHQNSVFHTVLKHVPWHVFDRLVAAHGADARVRRLSTGDQFVALLYGQLAGAQSLREIEAGLASHAHRLYHLGARAISRSTHIAALVGRSLDRTNDRLSRLYHAGYLDRPRAQLDYYPTAGSSPIAYALADRGAAS